MSLPTASEVIELAGMGAAMHLDMAIVRRMVWMESLNCMFAVVGVGFGELVLVLVAVLIESSICLSRLYECECRCRCRGW
jgi:hypothetical protein